VHSTPSALIERYIVPETGSSGCSNIDVSNQGWEWKSNNKDHRRLLPRGCFIASSVIPFYKLLTDFDSQEYEVFGFADDIEVFFTRMQTAISSESNWC
jgi:hypothetical protein